MDKRKAKSLIRELAKHRCIGFSKHCADRMDERSVNSDDFLHVLMWGKILDVTYDEKTEYWKCKISGEDIDGDSLTLIVAISETVQKIICVTVFD